MILFKKQLFDLEVKGQGPTKVIMVRDTPPYGHAPTRKNQTKTVCLPFVRREDIIIRIECIFFVVL